MILTMSNGRTALWPVLGLVAVLTWSPALQAQTPAQRRAAPADTVVLSVPEALERGLDRSATREAAALRTESAAGLAAQARAWPNPVLAVAAENVGQSTSFTGVPGTAGLEGQAILRFGLPVGSERGGAIRAATGRRALTDAELAATDLAVRQGVLGMIGAVLRDQLRAETASEELETLSTLAEALQRQADLGRAPAGDAARADLARGMAATRAGRREADLARGRAELSRLLALAPGTPTRLVPPTCGTLTGGVQPGVWTPPEVAMAEARVEIAEGGALQARGLRLPDVQPELGVRRSGGRSGLYLGLSTGLPLFDRGSRRIDAAVAEIEAAEAVRTDAERRWEAERQGALDALDALTRGGSAFDAEWFENLERAVVAAEARYTLGEGSLMELLDSRRARLQALDDYAEWQAEWWAARIEAARLDSGAITSDLVCIDPFREVAR